jgi:GNAT superfamily N-acetyltransferase
VTLTAIDRMSERIEREAIRSLVACSSGTVRSVLGLEASEVADGILLAADRDPSILLNRCVGLGSEHPPDPDAIERVAAIYARRGIGRYYLQLDQVELSAGSRGALASSGLVPARAWMKFRRGTGTPPPSRTDLRVELVSGAGADDFARVACAAFELSDAAVPLLAGLAADDRWSLFASYDGDEPAGAGALFVDGDAAWLDWAGTRPEFRRRGSQGALMAARIERALRLGARHLFTETGEAVEGDPQHSYRNILRAGFLEAHLRANYAPIAT